MNSEVITLEWLISANSKIYDHKTSFLKYGYIDWHQSYNFAIGDIIYIYSSRPESSISFVTRVDGVNMLFSDTRDDKLFWKKLDTYEKSKNGLYCKLTLISHIQNKSLSLEKLKEHGLKVAPQGALKLRGELRDYIVANS
ncbi:MAG: hypothetical protein KJ847_02960, partial [Firmicutes bacterium]|nr:hypothetical protein [Bacillota bacterium]